MRINKVRVALCATVAVFNSEVLQYVLADQNDKSPCMEGWTEWTLCSSESGLQESHNPNCPDFVQVQECQKIAGCGEFSPWSPSEMSCVAGTFQTRTRADCPEVREVKLCQGASTVCTDNWTGWTNCDTNNLQERHNPDCSAVEVRECSDCSGQCGEWGAWDPPYEGSADCVPGTVYKRSRVKCPTHTETKMCGSFCCRQCSPHATCQQLEGTCTCKTGYEGDGRVCTRIDVCAIDPCDQNADCSESSNPLESECNCKVGWRADIEAGKVDKPCVEEDECAANTHSCPKHSTCTNTPGSYDCICFEGFRKDEEGNCIDIDECSESSPCPSNSTCINEEGGHTCKCIDGFAGDATEESPCVNVDECLKDVCSANSICTDTEGSYLCSCPPGYMGTGTKEDPCSKIDYCGDANLHSCGPNSKCVNELPSYKCVCEEGYNGAGTLENPCTDIDECNVDLPIHDCDDNASCHNTDGSYTCECNSGFVGAGDRPGHNKGGCLDIDECAESPCDKNATCTNKVGGYTCTCRDGYDDVSKDGKECRDIDECATNTFTCHAAADCENTEGSYECVCQAGFIGDGKVCNDVDECESHPCGANTDCVNTIGGFSCECKSGYENLDSNTNSCSNIDECANGTATIPENADCEDTDGSYKWSCKEGYEHLGEGCSKIDWCAKEVCHHLASCAETENQLGYTCTCLPGYSGDGLAEGSCTDINECEGENSCASPEDGGVCTNTVGSYTCSCEKGYNRDGNSCSDIDECATNKHNCSPVGQCSNSKGSFTCTCNPGYQGDGVICMDIDECSEGTHNCEASSTCVNSCGSFECGCSDGFERVSAVSCQDIDECSTGVHNCSVNASCTNTSGSFVCQCNPGFEGDGVQCSDIDFCATRKGECNVMAECAEDSSGTDIKCTCAPGYEGDGFGLNGCKDIDECATGNFSCPEHAECTNTAGSYECACKVGFLSVGRSTDLRCNDIDECASSNSCASTVSGGVCENTIGSYTCSCREGFRGDGSECSDIDECTEGAHECGTNASCLNEAGSYSCVCEEGYKATDAYNCQDIDECAEESAQIPPNSTCVNNEGGYDFLCLAGYRRVDEKCQKIDYCKETGCSQKATCKENETGTAAICTCVAGYTGEGVGPDGCININECDNDVCSSFGPGGRCNDLEGSYECHCTVGWALVNGTCIDLNECMSGKMNTCDTVGGECTNTPGSYECSCKDGFQGDGHACSDVDECAGENSCHENAICTNSIGSYICKCQEGYAGDGQHCVDINECAKPSDNDCDSHRAICTNSVGSYSCACRPGFGGDGFTCTNIDECTIGDYTCQDNSHCVDSVGSYNCECDLGYHLNGEECIDVDECSTQTHDCSLHASCSNTVGSFTCTCIEGYQGDGINCSRIPLPCEQDLCGPHSICEDLNYTEHLCTCVEGYKMQDNACVDINECDEGHSCDSHANCINTDGSYSCECGQGYVGDGYNCSDIDECSDNGSCSPDAICTNTQGSFNCRCRSGFMGNGFSCVVKPEQGGDEFCTEWSSWTSCTNNATHSTRYCFKHPSKLEVKECPGKEQLDCGEFGNWSECPSDSGMQQRVRERYGQAGCETAREELECPNEEIIEHCGEWGPWTQCNVPIKGLKMKTRLHCSEEVQFEECYDETESGGEVIPGVCESWEPWTECKDLTGNGVFTQERHCVNNSAMSETRECGSEIPKECGPWGEWSECQGNKQTRARTNCPDKIEIKACATPGDECGPWGEWSACNIVVNGVSLKLRHRPLCNIFESEVCQPIEGETGCNGWSAWSACVNGVQERTCMLGISATESRICGDESCTLESEWTPSPCTGDEIITRQYNCNENLQQETSLCSSLPDSTCGEWGPWSKCDLSSDGEFYKYRKMMGCMEMEMALCSQDEISTPNTACGEWSECVSNEQTRKCEVSDGASTDVINEQRECGTIEVGPCGVWGDWSSCDVNGLEHRYKTLCPEVAETRACGSDVCSTQFDNWGSCGVPTEGMRIRHKLDCAPTVNCDCIESEECTIEMSTDAPEVSSEEEEEEEGSGIPTAAIAGGIAGVVLVGALAGGGAAYARSSPAASDEAEQLMFEDADGIEAGEDAREADTVIDITEEDDYWADGGDVE